MSWTQSDLDLVEAAIKALIAGQPIAEKSVGGRSLKYFSLQELRDLRAEMIREISATTRKESMPLHHIVPGRGV